MQKLHAFRADSIPRIYIEILDEENIDYEGS